jgi:hypothetical protein
MTVRHPYGDGVPEHAVELTASSTGAVDEVLTAMATVVAAERAKALP